MDDTHGTEENGLPPPPAYEMILDRPNMEDVPPAPWYEPPPFQGHWEDPAVAKGVGPNDLLIQTAPQQTLPPEVKLGFVDFLPQKEAYGYQDFKTLMIIVNDWLVQNPQYSVMNCECIDRPINSKGQVESYSTIRMKGIFSNTSFVRGVRLWVQPNLENKPVQRIWYMNVLPKPVAQNLLKAQYTGMGGRRDQRHAHMMAAEMASNLEIDHKVTVMTGMGSVTMQRQLIYPEFEDLDKTLQKLNEKLKSDPIPGTVLNTSCINMMYAKNFWDPLISDPFSRPYDPDISMWQIRSNSNLLYLQVLRIFYLQGPPQTVEIGMQDFEADVVEEARGTRRNPLYQTHTTLMAKAQHWLQQNPGLKLTNICTMRCIDTGSFNSKKAFHVAGSGRETFRDVIRIAHVSPGKSVFDLNTVQCKSFVPMRWQSRKSEGLSQLVGRVNHWLVHSGATVLFAETVEFYFDPDAHQKIDTETTAVNLVSYSGNYWMSGVRLYLHGHFTEPSLDVCPPIPAFGDPPKNSNESSSCVLL